MFSLPINWPTVLLEQDRDSHISAVICCQQGLNEIIKRLNELNLMSNAAEPE